MSTTHVSNSSRRNAKGEHLPSVAEVLAGLDAVKETAAGKAPAKKKAGAAAKKAPAKKASPKKAAAKKLSKVEEAIADGKPLPKRATKKAAGKALEAMTLAELKAEAKARGLTGYSTAKKADLLASLKKAGAAAKKPAAKKKALGAGLEEVTKATKASKGGKSYIKRAGGEIAEEPAKPNTPGSSVLNDGGVAVPANDKAATQIVFLLHHLDAGDAVEAMQSHMKGLPAIGKMEMLRDWVNRAASSEGITTQRLLAAAEVVSKDHASPTDIHNRLKAFGKAGLIALAKKHKVKVAAAATQAAVLKALLEAAGKGTLAFRKTLYVDIMAGPGGKLEPLRINAAAHMSLSEPRVAKTLKPTKKGYPWTVKDGYGKVFAGPFKTDKEASAALKKMQTAAAEHPAIDPKAKEHALPAAGEATAAGENAKRAKELLTKASGVSTRLARAVKEAKGEHKTALTDRLAQIGAWINILHGPVSADRLDTIDEGLEGLIEFGRLADEMVAGKGA